MLLGLVLFAAAAITAEAAAGGNEVPLDVLETTRASFTRKPQATRMDDGGIKIAFAVSAPTDVEVAVLDAKGKVVRHLAAGVLGPNAPAPLRKDSLTQELI